MIGSGVWEWILQIALIVVGLAGGGVGVVWLVNWLKAALRLEGSAAMAAAAVVSLVVALAELIAAGQIAPQAFEVSNLAALVLLVWVTSQEVYRRITS